MINNKYAVGIVGFGGMAGWHYELITERQDHMTIKGVFDIKQDRQDYAKTLGLIAYDSLEDLLADEEIDIVLCATPNDVHKDVVIKALRAGKNTVCEKPVALNLTELEEMIAVSEETGKVFSVHQNRRWDQDFRTIKKIYDENAIGEVFNIESRIHGSRGIPGDWRGHKEFGGGMVLDWGVHLIDQVLLLLPDEKVSTIYCQLHHVTNELVDDGFHLVMNFSSGKRVLIEVGTSNFVNLPRWYVQGRDGTAIAPDFTAFSITKVTDWNKNDAVPIKTAAGLTKTMAPRTEETIKTEVYPQVMPDIIEFYQNFTATIEGREEQYIKHHEVVRVMKLMEAAFKSAELNQVVEFEK